MRRRDFLFCAGAAVGQSAIASILPAMAADARFAWPRRPDFRLRIENCSLDIGNRVTVRTIAYNGQVPGPTLRLTEGRPVSIEVTNATSKADLVHWHGLGIDSRNDGAMEEGSPMIEPGRTLLYSFTPRPAGTRWYHTHVAAGSNLTLGTYSGQYGFLLIDGGQDPGGYDWEVNLAIHHWEPSFAPMVETMREKSANMPLTTGSDVVYRYATINQHILGTGEPIHVKKGQRVLMRLLNASSTENVVLALPGHTFKVVAMDGNPVPNARSVEVLSLAVAERVDAIVENEHSGYLGIGLDTRKEPRNGIRNCR